MLTLLAGCANLNDGGTGGGGGAIGDPEPITRPIPLRCTNNFTTVVSGLSWELTVDPGRIVSGELFGADLSAVAVFAESFIDLGQETIEGGFRRVHLVDLRGTVHVREGATASGPDPVLTPEPIQSTCTYDDNGNTGAEAGPFPACSQENDNSDGSNDECTGLDGMPLPENPCAQYVDIPTSDDCAPGGRCDTLDGGSGNKNKQCMDNGFCVSGPVEMELRGSLEGYRAEASGNVLFGWDDQAAGGETLPPAVFEDPIGPNGMRVIAAGLPVALECTMTEGQQVPDGMGGLTQRWIPVSDTSLIRFQIQEP